MQSNQPRLNYNVPRHLVLQIRNIAAQLGTEPSYWIRKVLEKAVEEASNNS